MSRVVILGGTGMLGRDLAREFAEADVAALGSADVDLRDRAALDAAVAGASLVVNAAAYTRVDDAEGDEEAATALNGVGAGHAAAAARAAGARFVQVSTDYVFAGTATSPYPEDAPLEPLGAYGRSKAEGERRVRAAHPGALVVRTAWLYGQHGPNFPRTMLRLAGEREHLDVVTDQVGQPTWTRDLAAGIARLVAADAPAGVYHGTNAGAASWFEFARAVFELSGLDPERIRPTDSASFRRPAPRPGYSVLGHDAWGRVGVPALRPWRDALAAAIHEGALTP